MDYPDESKQAFLEDLVRLCYPQGDNFYVSKTKGGSWRLGYTNDHPLQHGKGEEMMLQDCLVTTMMNGVPKVKV